MDLQRAPVLALLLAGYWFLLLSVQVRGQLQQNVSEPVKEESLLPAKERFRRLIPYMTYYLDQGYNTHNQYVDPGLQRYQPVQQIPNNLPLQYQQQQQKYSLVPIGYLVGGGYKQVPVYSTPVAQADYSSLSYTPQNPSDLTQMITQNYLNIAKQMSNLHTNQRPVQFTTKVQTTNENQRLKYLTEPHKSQSQTKSFVQHYQQRYQQNSRRQPYLLKTFRPQYNIPKGDSYVQIPSNYELNYNARQNNKHYDQDPDVMTITKSQELVFPIEDYQESIQSPVSTTSLPLLQSNYEDSVPTLQTGDHNSLIEMLAEYQLTKALPEKVDPSNIGHSIQTLSNILKLLKKVKTHQKNPISLPDSDGNSFDNGVSQNYSPFQTEGSTPGRAGIDYPAYSEIPETRFSCKNQRYKGFFGDPDTSCQVWHYCDLNGGQASFLCPNGTIFSQVALTCDWWFNVKCASTAQLYVLNERLYKYILPHKPSFPEDFAGPLVDQYLTLKFQELEAKKKNSTTEKPPSTLQVLLNDEINQAVK